jgi:hypothetical protein
MTNDERPSLRDPADPGELETLRESHRFWLIDYRRFADGWHYDARPLEPPNSPRLVRRTATELETDIAAVENGTWRPPWPDTD